MKLIVGTVLLLLLAACGVSTSNIGNTASVSACTVYGYGYDVRVAFSGAGASGLCSDFIRQWSETSGIYWDSTYSAPQEPPLETVCTLAQNDSLMIVTDDGGQYYGQQVCAAFAAGGWTES